MLRLGLAALALILAASSLQPMTAEAQDPAIIEQPFTGKRPYTLDVHGGVSWWGVGLGTGVRFGIPIIANGFIGKLNNSVYLSLGADFYFIRYTHRGPDFDRRYGPGFGFPLALHWEFYFTEKLSAFAELGVNIFVGPWVFRDDAIEGFGHYPAAFILFQAGGKFQFSESVALVVRLGIPYASVGLSFSF